MTENHLHIEVPGGIEEFPPIVGVLVNPHEPRVRNGPPNRPLIGRRRRQLRPHSRWNREATRQEVYTPDDLSVLNGIAALGLGAGTPAIPNSARDGNRSRQQSRRIVENINLRQWINRERQRAYQLARRRFGVCAVDEGDLDNIAPIPGDNKDINEIIRMFEVFHISEKTIASPSGQQKSGDIARGPFLGSATKDCGVGENIPFSAEEKDMMEIVQKLEAFHISGKRRRGSRPRRCC